VQLRERTPLAGLEAEWRALADRSDNVFATWEWLDTWWQHFGRGRPLHIEPVRDIDGNARAIVPLYTAATRPVTVMRFMGHGPTDQLGPVCAPDDRALAAPVVAGVAAPLFIGDELSADATWTAIPGAIVLDRPANPVVTLAGVAADELFTRSSKTLRVQLARKERTLASWGRVSYRVTATPDQLGGDLSMLFALHDERWRAVGGSRAFAGRERFHRDFAAQALARGWLRLHFLELDGHPIAALYNLRFAGVESNYQAGRDPRFDDASPGLLLHAHAIRDAHATGTREYRFLRGDEPYKRRFADADPGLVSIAIARTPVARALVRAIRPVPRLPREVRRRVPAPFAWGTGGSPVWGAP
jgi:CelD/BcsL family acetyltransferase involved in cellulose biosynthesis